MRLWHQALLFKLPRQQLLGQHRECCALRGKGWGRKHSTVDYVFEYPIERLFVYHTFVMNEMRLRGFSPDADWSTIIDDKLYRGKQLGWEKIDFGEYMKAVGTGGMLYPEHDDDYYQGCIENLRRKGVNI